MALKTPADINPAAKPYDAKPSAAILTQTSEALEQLAKEEPAYELEPGIYWIDRTYSVNGASNAQTPRQVYFNNTEIRASGPIGNYTAVRSEDDGSDLAGLDEPSSNLPVGETTRVVMDVTNSNYSRYLGLLTVNANKLALAAIGATNRHKQNGAGGIGSCWDNVVIKSARWGLFGTPRYGQTRNFYAGAFVGNIWQRLRVWGCNMPLLLASNTGDDQFFGELNLISPPAARSYLYAVNFNFGSAYLGGDGDEDYGIDMQRASLIGGTLYAEGHYAAPIIMRERALLKAVPKYGGGANTVFKHKAFIEHNGPDGGGELWADQTMLISANAEAVVAIRAVANSKRNWIVKAPFSEAEKKPFRAIGELSGKDQLLSFFSEGAAKWTGPALTRQAGWG